MPIDEKKKRAMMKAFVESGRLGGLKGGKTRMASLDAAGRSELARSGAQARWAKDRITTPVHIVVKTMLEAVHKTGKAHVLFVDQGIAMHCEAENTVMVARWFMTYGDEACAGLYRPGARFSDVMSDVLAIP